MQTFLLSPFAFLSPFPFLPPSLSALPDYCMFARRSMQFQKWETIFSSCFFTPMFCRVTLFQTQILFLCFFLI